MDVHLVYPRRVFLVALIRPVESLLDVRAAFVLGVIELLQVLGGLLAVELFALRGLAVPLGLLVERHDLVEMFVWLMFE